MISRDALLDLHSRSHRVFRSLLDHCENLNPEDLKRNWNGFGIPTLLLQFDHVIRAERYWISVLEWKTDCSENEADRESLSTLRRFQEQTCAKTCDYLDSRSDDELNAELEYQDWRGDTRRLIPARVLLRTQTHLFHHQGQISAICRSAGHPVPEGLDFPVD